MSLPPNDTLPIGSGESNLQSASEQITTCSLLTGVGRSAIAVIEIDGDSAGVCLQKLFRAVSTRPMKVGQLRFGQWHGAPSSVQAPSQTSNVDQRLAVGQSSTPPSDAAPTDPQNAVAEAAESVVVVPISPRRYEIHCHGGNAAIERIFNDLEGLGVKRGDPSLAGSLAATSSDDNDRMILEAVEILPRCTTVRTAAIALDQVRGALRDWRLQAIAALQQDAASAEQIAKQAASIAIDGRIGVRLTRPWDVVLAGPPNVGKSSLINAMVGYDRSITMDIAGTTRDVLDADTVFDGWPIRLRDTAGLHESEHVIEKQGIQRAFRAVQEADLVVQVTQPGMGLNFQTLRQSTIRPGLCPVPVLCVVNKIDLASKLPGEESSAEEEIQLDATTLKTVATTGQGISELIDAIVSTLLAKIPERGAPVPINPRQLAWIDAVAEQSGDAESMLSVLRRG